MTSAGFGWRAGVLSLFALLLLSTIVGGALMQLDDQYGFDSIGERVLVGVFGGLWGAVLVSPLAVLLAAVAGIGAGMRHGVQSDRAEEPRWDAAARG